MRQGFQTPKSGTGGFQPQRSNGRHRAFVAGALTAMMMLGGCDPGDFRKPEPAVEAPAVRPYCESNDCSGFPKGYYSIQMNDQWLYIPGPQIVRATSDVALGPRFRSEASNGYLFPNDWDAETMRVIEQDGQVIFGAVWFKFEVCCPDYGRHYKLPALNETRVSRVTFSKRPWAEDEFLPPQRSSDVIRAANDAPAPFQGIAERYFLRVSREGETLTTTGVTLQAWSKEPMAFGGHLKVQCVGPFCDVEVGHENEPRFAQIRFLTFLVGDCLSTKEGCATRAAIDQRFARIERFLEDFEAMLEIMKQRPEEEAPQ